VKYFIQTMVFLSEIVTMSNASATTYFNLQQGMDS